MSDPQEFIDQSAAARQLGVSRRTVFNWIGQIEEAGFSGVQLLRGRRRLVHLKTIRGWREYLRMKPRRGPAPGSRFDPRLRVRAERRGGRSDAERAHRIMSEMERLRDPLVKGWLIHVLTSSSSPINSESIKASVAAIQLASRSGGISPHP